MLCLRACYFVVAYSVQSLRYLKFGVAFILAFIGVKLMVQRWYHISADVSCVVIIIAFAGSAFASLMRPRCGDERSVELLERDDREDATSIDSRDERPEGLFSRREERRDVPPGPRDLRAM